MKENLLITGGCGFVGSNLALLLKKKYPSLKIRVMDNLHRRGSELNISRLRELDIPFIHGDIRNPEDFEEVGPCEVIIDAAAEPSVLSGINSAPEYCLNTNLGGTLNMLNYAVKHKTDIVFLSTSRVYPIPYIEQILVEEKETRFEITPNQILPGVSPLGISESFPLDKARSLYGTTKLASELFLEEYKEFLGLRYIINRCGVIAGPYQMGKVDQGVAVLWMAKHFWQKDLQYIGYGGTGKQVRDFLHIQDLFELIDYQLNHFEELNGQTFNAGGGRNISTSLQELTKICEEITGNKINIHPVKENRSGDIRIYLTDNSKVTQYCGWSPQLNIKDIMTDIYDWIRQHEPTLKPLLNL